MLNYQHNVKSFIHLTLIISTLQSAWIHVDLQRADEPFRQSPYFRPGWGVLAALQKGRNSCSPQFRYPQQITQVVTHSLFNCTNIASEPDTKTPPAAAKHACASELLTYNAKYCVTPSAYWLLYNEPSLFYPMLDQLSLSSPILREETATT